MVTLQSVVVKLSIGRMRGQETARAGILREKYTSRVEIFKHFMGAEDLSRVKFMGGRVNSTQVFSPHNVSKNLDSE